MGFVGHILRRLYAAAASERESTSTHTSTQATHTHARTKNDERKELSCRPGGLVGMLCRRSFLQGPLAGIDITNLDPEIIQSAGAGFVNEFFSDYFCSDGTSPGELTNTLSGFGGGSGGPISLLATFFALGAEQAWNGAANVIQAGNAGNPLGAAVSGCRR